MKTVIKRDGRKVPFDANKIVNAITSAMSRTDSVDEALASYIASRIGDIAEDKTVEEIQDLVEHYLMNSDRKDVAKTYILYRAERTKQREMNSGMVKEAWSKIRGDNVVNANANVDERTFGGRKGEASSALQKEIALRFNMSPEIAEAHRNGLIYQHDLDSYNVGMHNCLFIDFKHLFENGFSTRNGDVRPPTSFSTACQLVAVAFQIQSQCQYGGVASAHIDYDLAPFVAMSFKRHLKDGLKYVLGWTEEEINAEEAKGTLTLSNETYWVTDEKLCAAWNYATDMLEREGKQAAQGLYHNLNTLESRAGSQVPFTSINLGRDTSPEGRLVTRWILEASLEGIGKHRVTSIFPISIFCYKKGVNTDPGDPNYDLKLLALKSMAKRIYPNWVNDDFSEAHEDANDIDTIYCTMGK